MLEEKKLQHTNEISATPTQENPSHPKIKDNLPPAFKKRLTLQTLKTDMKCFEGKEEASIVYETTKQTIEALSPADPIEAMIVSQMIATHNASMNCFAAGQTLMDPSVLQFRDSTMNQGVKSSKVFVQLVDALQRYRQKDVSTQKLTVGHVEVHEGAQAIVGNINKTNSKVE